MIAGWVVVTLAAASTGFAEEDFSEAGVMQRVHADLDQNGNGTIDREEYARVGDRDSFEDLDRDQDGQISVEELHDWVMLTPPRPRRNIALQPLASPVDKPLPRQPTGPQQGNPVGAPPSNSPEVSRPSLGGTGNAHRLPTASVSRAPTPIELMAILSALVGLGTLAGGLWRMRTRKPPRRRQRR